jgi:hypothetical protein
MAPSEIHLSRKTTLMVVPILTMVLTLNGCGKSSPNAPAEPVDQERTVFVPSAIDPTGSVDVTDALTQFFATVPDSTTICFPANARYRVEGTLLLQNRHGLTFDGYGATIFAATDGSDVSPPLSLKRHWPQGRRHWLFESGSGIVIRNLNVEGSNPNAGVGDLAYREDRAFQHGFAFHGVQGVELDHVSVRRVYGDFVYLGAEGGTWTSNVRIHDSHFEANGRQGIAVTGGRDILIEHNYIGQVRRSSIDLEPHSQNGGAENIVIRENDFGPGHLLFLASAGIGSNVGQVTIESNRLEMPMSVVVSPPPGYRRGPFSIIDNVSVARLGAPVALMRFSRIDGLTVRGNVMALSERRNMTGVLARESCDVTVELNQFNGAAREFEVLPFNCN